MLCCARATPGAIDRLSDTADGIKKALWRPQSVPVPVLLMIAGVNAASNWLTESERACVECVAIPTATGKTFVHFALLKALHARRNADGTVPNP